MKQLFKPLAVLFCLAAVFSCSKKAISDIPDAAIVNPISDYTITPDPADGFTFKYTNLSKNYTKLEWRFGDDTLKTDANPTHTFLATGKYTTDLKTFSTSGNVSHKYTDIYIVPDSIIKLNAVKTGVTGQVKFSAQVKGTVAKYLWTFTDGVTNKVTTDTSPTPIVNYTIGSFNALTVQITTNQGSIASLSRNATTEGIAINITQSYINNNPLYPSLISNNENTVQGVNEGSSKLVDGNITTKFGYYSAFPKSPETITLQFPAPVTVKIYGLCNGNDSNNDRDPKEWYIEGSNDSFNWVVLDHIILAKGFYDMATDLGVKGNGPTGIDAHFRKWWYFPIASPAAYSYYRWRITDMIVPSKNAFQMSELAFFK